MAIQLEANYSKKIGLPKYSSHQFSLTVKSELNDINQVQQETNRLYALLQASVDREIQQVGFLPESNGAQNVSGNPAAVSKSEFWACSEKQRDLILKIVEENHLEKSVVENLTKQRFDGVGVKMLNTMQASMLIKELLEKYPGKSSDNGNRYRGRQYTGGRK